MDPRLVICGVSAICGIIIGYRVGKQGTNPDYIDGFEAGARACDIAWKEGIKSKRIQINKYGDIFRLQ